eukprot:3048162-Amphidinium_carterae.2
MPLPGAPDRSSFLVFVAPSPSSRAVWYNRQGTHTHIPNYPALQPLPGAPDRSDFRVFVAPFPSSRAL